MVADEAAGVMSLVDFVAAEAEVGGGSGLARVVDTNARKVVAKLRDFPPFLRRIVFICQPDLGGLFRVCQLGTHRPPTAQAHIEPKEQQAAMWAAAQERGEIGSHGGDRQVSHRETCKATEVLPPKDLHEARKLRDAEKLFPMRIAFGKPNAEGC